MRTRAFGPTRVRLPVIGLGTWNLERDPDASVAAIRLAIDLGMTHLDTAEMYGAGVVEEIVGRAIEGRRDRVFLASKVLPSNATRRGTVEACERSLRRLKTDHLDLYLLHWRDGGRLGDTIEAFDDLVRGGRIRFWGVSNFDVPDLEEALALAGPGRIACNQVLYHLGERGIENAVGPWCARHEVALVGYSPLGQGAFPPARPGADELRRVATERSVPAAEVALAFLTRDEGAFVIPKAVEPAHVREDAAAGDLVLTEREVERLDRAFPRPDPGPLATA